MREFRKNQKKLKKIMTSLVVITALYFFVYIGIEPMIANLSDVATVVLGYVGDILILVCLSILFVYFSKYGKSDKFLENIEYELSDCGYYFTNRNENTINSYLNAIVDDLKNNGFSVNTNETINELDFDYVCRHRGELMYIFASSTVDKNDIIAYLDSAMYDVTSVNVRRKANGVVVFLCDNADDGAVSLSKMITPLGKKEQIKFAIAIVEVTTGKVYFLGNNVSKCQSLIANYVMNCEVPIDDKYKGENRLPFQDDLEEHMKSFNLKDFKDGTFYAH